MAVAPPKKISVRMIPWKDRDHLFTPPNITKYEFACCKDCIYKKIVLKQRVRALPHGPCVWIIKGGIDETK